MKFSCPQCATRYTLADDKVPAGAALRFACKTCGNVIRLQRDGVVEGGVPASDSASKQPAPAASTRISSLAEVRAMAQASVTSQSSAAATEPEKPVASTRVASLAEIRAMASSSDGMRAPDAPAAVAPAVEWHLVIAGSQQGPFTSAEVADLITRAEADGRTHAWCDGMAEWQRLATLPEFAAAAASAGDAKWRAKKPTAPPLGSSAAATVMMSAAQLRDEVARSAPAEPTGVPTKVMPAAQLRDHVAKTKPPPPTVAPAAPTVTEATAMMSAAQLRVALGTGGAEASADHAATTVQPRPVAPAAVPSSTPAVIPTLLEDSALGDPLLDGEEPVLLETPRSVPTFDRPPTGDLDAPPGEATRVFIANSGIYRQRRMNKIWAAVAVGVVAILGVLVGLDVAGIYTLPGMGVVYDVTGFVDPNVDRALARVESRLTAGGLSADERHRLQSRLEGLRFRSARRTNGAAKDARGGGAADARDEVAGAGRPNGVSDAVAAAVSTQGVADTAALNAKERALAADVFGDVRKREVGLKLVEPGDIQTPNLPAGLTQEAIYKVISDNARAMKLCLEDAFKKGEKPSGRMDVQMTIAADGSIVDAIISTERLRTSALGACTLRRVRGWKFPRFNGEPVTVMFPYVLSAAF